MEQQRETEAKSGADTTADICTALQNWLCAIVLYCKNCNLRLQNKEMSLETYVKHWQAIMSQLVQTGCT